jgi:hypothetical protein
MQRDITILLDIVQAARLVLAFKEGMTKVTFDADLKTQCALLWFPLHIPTLFCSLPGAALAWDRMPPFNPPVDCMRGKEEGVRPCGAHTFFALPRDLYGGGTPF